MIDAMQILHQTGYIYNDLKPQNIMITRSNNKINFVLIDFGLVKKFNKVEKNGKVKHVSEQEEVENFEGNLLFATPSQMCYKMTSRRDDLISVLYMILYLLNGEKFPI
jgi:serine/threonine protein kinase